MPRRQPTTTATARPRAARRTRTAAVLLSLAAVLAAAPPTARAGASWRLPVDGDVVAGFRVTPGAPFAAGQRRGIDLRARPGTAVRAACSGRVRYAGPVPQRGRGVTVRCAPGPWLATHLGLARLAIGPGRVVVAGATVIGGVGRTGRIRLGARRAGRRHGYVDPLMLLRDEVSPPSVAPPPGPLGPRTRRGEPPRRAPMPVHGPAPPPTVPRLAWFGLAVVAAGAPLTLAGRARRRARRRRQVPGLAHR